jgi:hypothetical protein
MRIRAGLPMDSDPSLPADEVDGRVLTMNVRVAYRGADVSSGELPHESRTLRYQNLQKRNPVARRFVRMPLVLFLLAFSTIEAPARVTGPQRDAAREAAITEELRSPAPEAAPDFEAATVALDTHDYLGAAAGYRRVLEKAPDFDAALRRPGVCLIEEGKKPRKALPSRRVQSRVDEPPRTFTVSHLRNHARLCSRR